MYQDENAARQALVDAMGELETLKLNRGTSGNVSLRWGEGMLITPSGLPACDLAPQDMVFVNWAGEATGTLRPSSEWRFHLDILTTRPDFDAVVHSHSIYATAIAMLGEDLPAVHYMIAAAGGATVRCAAYATFGTKALSQAVLVALEGRNACLMANHGLIACAKTVSKAVWLANEVEVLAQQYAIARSIGTPIILSDDEIDEVKERFKTYGSAAQKS